LNKWPIKRNGGEFMVKKAISLLLLGLMLLVSPLTWAKDMTHRLGIGPRVAFSFEQASLAGSYYLYRDLSLVGALGINTDEHNSRFGIMAGVRRIIFEEQMLNFYFGGNFSIISVEAAGVNQSGYELSALAGSEFFFQGLDNLAFLFEGGVGIVSLKNGTKLITTADTPVKAGVIFYF
jgi:hypothetical protein